MSAVYNDLTDDEIEARQALLRSLGVKPRKPDTRGDVAPRRRPLGLAPVPGDAPEAGGDDDNMDAEGRVILHDGYSFSFKDGVSPEFLAASAPVDLVYEMANAVTSIADEVHRKAKKNIAEVRSEVAELKAALIEARHEIRELKLIQEACGLPAVANAELTDREAFPAAMACKGRSDLAASKAKEDRLRLQLSLGSRGPIGSNLSPFTRTAHVAFPPI
jgi:hypothetical protein